MYSIRRLYNQNRGKIWMVIIIIASCILLLQLVNWWVKESNNKKIKQVNNTVNTSNTSNQIQITSQQSAVTGDKISNESLSSVTEVITNFLENCNNDKIEEAYNMLTEECKKEVYSSVEDFKTYYCEIFLKNYKASFEVENWFGNTYKVDIIPDMLSTGKSNEGYVNQDYITIKKVDGEYKLNINSYIGRTDINRTKEQDGVFIKVNYKDVYMDYEKYNITVKNGTNKNIFLDSKEDIRTMYLEDKNEVQYPAITNEIEKSTLRFIRGEERTFDIKYYNKYISTRTIRRMVFSNVILDSDKYENKNENNETTILVNI